MTSTDAPPPTDDGRRLGGDRPDLAAEPNQVRPDATEPVPPSSGLDELIERIEGSARLDRFAERIVRNVRPLLDSPAAGLLRGEPLGHRAHPLLTDLPIGFFTSAMVVDLVGGRSGRVAARRLTALGLLSAIPTAMTGAVDLHDASADPRVRRVGVVHAVGNAVAFVLYFRSWRSRRLGNHVRGMAWGGLGAVAASASGHLGGHMAFARGANVAADDSGERPIVDLTRVPSTVVSRTRPVE